MLYYGTKKPTKERIIDAAFSLFNDFRFKDISLNEVAVAAGISKTAIFRHFENKDSLVNTMSAYLFDTIADIINGIYNTIQFSTDKTDCEEKLWKQAITQCIKHI
nr:TetR/AcrR family transcriptional regulator [Treponema sp.]